MALMIRRPPGALQACAGKALARRPGGPRYGGVAQSSMEAGPTFELLEHPADIGFRAFGNTLPELFANCAVALLSIACDLSAVQPAKGYRLAVSSGDRESLLVDWLNEVLYWFDGKHVAFAGFQVDHFDDTSLAATGFGEPRESARHPGKLIVKAVTYHQLRIQQREGRWLAEVYVDI